MQDHRHKQFFASGPDWFIRRGLDRAIAVPFVNAGPRVILMTEMFFARARAFSGLDAIP